MKFLKKSLALLFSFILIGTMLTAQVTIGSGHAPVQGALLDLKESNDLSTKGLLLPRVSLSDPGTILSAAENEEVAHTGMIVYHIKSEECIYQMPSGVYLWDGESWIPLQDKMEEAVVDAQILAVDDNNKAITYEEYAVHRGGAVKMLVDAPGTADGVSWTHNGNVVSTSKSYTLSPTQTSDFGRYFVELTDNCGSKESIYVDIIEKDVNCINPPRNGKIFVELPGITDTKYPMSPNGGLFELQSDTYIFQLSATVDVENVEEIQWYKGAVIEANKIPGANSLTYNPNIQGKVTAADTGLYTCLIRNQCGTIEDMPSVNIQLNPIIGNCIDNEPMDMFLLKRSLIITQNRYPEPDPVQTVITDTPSLYKVRAQVDIINQIVMHSPIGNVIGVHRSDWYKLTGQNPGPAEHNGHPIGVNSRYTVERNGPGSAAGLYEIRLYDRCLNLSDFKIQIELVEK